MDRARLKKDKSGKEESGKGQFCKGKIEKRAIMNMRNLKKDK